MRERKGTGGEGVGKGEGRDIWVLLFPLLEPIAVNIASELFATSQHIRSHCEY